MKTIECPCCNSLTYNFKNQYLDYEHNVCKECGYEGFSKEKSDELSEFYEADPDYNDDLAVSTNHKALLQWNHKKVLGLLKSDMANSGMKTLDIGCFNGFFVKELVLSGVDAYGVDFNSVAVEFGKEHYKLDDKISTDSLDDLISKDMTFDVVTLFEVIEHVDTSPSEFLSRIFKLVKENGTLVVSCPNSKMMWRPDLDFPPHHISRFSPSALKECVETAGGEVYRSYEQMSVFDLIRNYIGAKIFRSKSSDSMRGGEFKNKGVSNLLRKLLNKIKWMMYVLLYPLDKIMYYLGFRYIGQVVVAKKN